MYLFGSSIACAAAAVEQLQIKQVTHASNIIKQSAIKDIRSALTPAPELLTNLVDPHSHLSISFTFV
jgi:hypothetical protein